MSNDMLYNGLIKGKERQKAVRYKDMTHELKLEMLRYAIKGVDETRLECLQRCERAIKEGDKETYKLNYERYNKLAETRSYYMDLYKMEQED